MKDYIDTSKDSNNNDSQSIKILTPLDLIETFLIYNRNAELAKKNH